MSQCQAREHNSTTIDPALLIEANTRETPTEPTNASFRASLRKLVILFNTINQFSNDFQKDPLLKVTFIKDSGFLNGILDMACFALACTSKLNNKKIETAEVLQFWLSLRTFEQTAPSHHRLSTLFSSQVCMRIMQIYHEHFLETFRSKRAQINEFTNSSSVYTSFIKALEDQIKAGEIIGADYLNSLNTPKTDIRTYNVEKGFTVSQLPILATKDSVNVLFDKAASWFMVDTENLSTPYTLLFQAKQGPLLEIQNLILQTTRFEPRISIVIARYVAAVEEYFSQSGGTDSTNKAIDSYIRELQLFTCSLDIPADRYTLTTKELLLTGICAFSSAMLTQTGSTFDPNLLASKTALIEKIYMENPSFIEELVPEHARQTLSDWLAIVSPLNTKEYDSYFEKVRSNRLYEEVHRYCMFLIDCIDKAKKQYTQNRITSPVALIA